nr:MAG TPA: hypothetical protein [Caudoviricetes sp.]DAH13087.1 MAG TPA: hypothetical protein [Caudoviricetes sp.]
MKGLKEVTDIIYEGDDKCKMREANEIYYSAADYVRQNNPDVYRSLINRAEEILYNFDLAWAQEKVHGMTPVGERWTYEDVVNFVKSKGLEDHFKEFYLAMNMYYNDSKDTGQKYAGDSPDFYFDLAQDFLNDEDAPPYKVAKYFTMV